MKTLNIIRKEGYVLLQLDRGKVNAINQEMIRELRAAFKELNADNTVGGVLLTGIPRFFSAGLDVIELYDYSEAKIREFFIDFATLHVEMVRFPKPLVCAINGYSPAGGTVLAITADYRVMAEGEKYTIGLNEVAVSVQISQNLVEGYAFWLGKGLANRYIMGGHLLNTTEALNGGLVDAVVPAEELLSRAEQQMKQYLSADPDILRNTKAKLRKNWWDSLDTNGEEELEQALTIWWKPEVRARMKKLIDRLTKK